MNRSKPSRRFACFLVVVIAASLATETAFAWGDHGHEMINQAAVRKLPREMPVFLKAAETQLIYLGPEPDRWRLKDDAFLKNAQEPDHFIDLEEVEGMSLPVGRYKYMNAISELPPGADGKKVLPDQVGFLPYETMEVYERLKVAFREYRRLEAAHRDTRVARHNAIFYAGWLGHYVADSSDPHHTTIHHHGWVGDNPNGYSTNRNIHSKFEAAFVEDNITLRDFDGLVTAPSLLADPFQDYLKYLRATHDLVPTLYEIDKRHGFDVGGTPEGKDFVDRRLAAGAQMLVNLWYTAWIESGKPVKDKYTPPSLPRVQKTRQKGN